jgi:hypothetical protein
VFETAYPQHKPLKVRVVSFATTRDSEHRVMLACADIYIKLNLILLSTPAPTSQNDCQHNGFGHRCSCVRSRRLSAEALRLLPLPVELRLDIYEYVYPTKRVVGIGSYLN